MRRIVLLACVLASSASAQTVGVSVRAGTMGVGIDLSTPLLDTVTLRASGRTLAFDQRGLLDASDLGVDGLDLDYDADIGLGAAGLMVDWHPVGNTFRITAGAFLHGNNAAAEIRAAEPYYDESLDRTFSVERVGTLRVEVDYAQRVAPYLGIGAGDLTAGAFGLTADAGVAFVGPPTIAMSGTGLIGGTADPANVATLQAGLDSFRFHPVVSVGLKTSFSL